MVSKASEDLPEPERPGNTTSLSRGISISTFLRLCSRAPRMVIARDAEPALGWRFALSTSSISAFPGTRNAPRWARIAGQGRDQAPIERMLEHRKNDEGFPVPCANHQRIVCAMAFSSEVDTGSRQENASEADFWQQQSAASPKQTSKTNASVPGAERRRWQLQQEGGLEVIVHADLNTVQIECSRRQAARDNTREVGLAF